VRPTAAKPAEFKRVPARSLRSPGIRKGNEIILVRFSPSKTFKKTDKRLQHQDALSRR